MEDDGAQGAVDCAANFVAAGFPGRIVLHIPDQLEALMVVLLVLNASRRCDIAVDGLAVDILPPSELGVGKAPRSGTRPACLGRRGPGLGQRVAGLVGCLPGDGRTGDGGCADGDAGPRAG